MTDKIKSILDAQIMEELYSSYLYVALSARLEAMNLKGAANWMMVQAKEEVDHAMGFFKFLVDRGEEPNLMAIASPDVSKIKTMADVFKAGLEHEKKVTALISNIYKMAKEEEDHALESFIKWYIDEQVEEEANATEVIGKVSLIGDGPALFILDQELATRMYVPSGPYAGKA